MKKTFMLCAFVVIISSCNSGRLTELEAENLELKATIERLSLELELSKIAAEQATAMAIQAQKVAKEQAANVLEATEKK